MGVFVVLLDEKRNFEYICLGEVRILGVLREYFCIVEIYGYKIFIEWIIVLDEKFEKCVLRFAIFMEYVRGGFLKVNFFLYSKSMYRFF